jgi:subtilisin family serine protease
VEDLGGKVERVHDEIGLVIVSELDEAASASLRRRPEVESVSRDRTLRWIEPEIGAAVLGGPIALGDQSAATYFPYQWNLRQVSADDAWPTTNQGLGALICVLDTGVDTDHPDLIGKIDFSRSTSFVPSERDIEDRNWHGTFVAAIASSNGTLVASVAPAADLCIVKVLNRHGRGLVSGLIAGIMHAASFGADVINMSLGAYLDTSDPAQQLLVEALQSAIDYANAQGVLLVAGSHEGFSGAPGINLDDDPPEFLFVPSQLDHVLSVGATNPAGALPDYASFGRTGVDVMAPGGDGPVQSPPDPDLPPDPDNVFSACPDFYSLGALVCGAKGTSFAAPIASGAAAVVEAEAEKNVRGNQLEHCVTIGADRVAGPGLSILFGHGRVNVLGAVRCKEREL